MRKFFVLVLVALAVLWTSPASAQPLSQISFPDGQYGHYYAHTAYSPDACVALGTAYTGTLIEMAMYDLDVSGSPARYIADTVPHGSNVCSFIPAGVDMIHVRLYSGGTFPVRSEMWELWRSNNWIANRVACQNC